MRKYTLLAGCLGLSIIRAFAQYANPVAIPVSYSNGHPYALIQDDEAAAAQKRIKRTMVGLITTTDGRHDTDFTFYKTAYARNGTRFTIDRVSFSDSDLSHIVYDRRGRIVQTTLGTTSRIGCGSSVYTSMGSRVYIKNIFKGNQLSQTIMKHNSWIGERARDTSQNKWIQEDYQYNRRGRKIREIYRIINANSDPRTYVAKRMQYAYDKYGRLRWSVQPFDVSDFLTQDTLAMIPDNFDRLYMRQEPEWRDSFLALEYGRQWESQILFRTINARNDADNALLEPFNHIWYLDGYCYSTGRAGRLVKRIHLGEWDLRSNINVDSFFYDKKGRLVRWSIHDLIHNQKQWTFDYDQSGRVTACDLVAFTGNGFFSKPTVDKDSTKHFLLSYNANGTLRQIILQAIRFGKPIAEHYFVAYQYY